MLPRRVSRAPRLWRPNASVVNLSCRQFSTTPQAFAAFPNEPVRPKMVTDLPGPKSQQRAKELDHLFDTKSLNMIVDYKKSIGN